MCVCVRAHVWEVENVCECGMENVCVCVRARVWEMENVCVCVCVSRQIHESALPFKLYDLI